MKKKILVLIGLVMLTTGCNATINVNIDKDSVKIGRASCRERV